MLESHHPWRLLRHSFKFLSGLKPSLQLAANPRPSQRWLKAVQGRAAELRHRWCVTKSSTWRASAAAVASHSSRTVAWHCSSSALAVIARIS